MSRIGKQPVIIPNGVEVKLAGGFVIVKGPKGEVKEKINPAVKIKIDKEIVEVNVKNPTIKKNRALWGLFQRLISNMVEGVSKGYEKKLEIEGVGYKVSLSGRNLQLIVGFSHPINFELPEGISASIDNKTNSITINGINKQLVGETAARIRRIKKPEPYQGKGIRYAGEVIRRKAGKTAKTAA